MTQLAGGVLLIMLKYFEVTLRLGSHLLKKVLFKNDEKCFLCHVKSSFDTFPFLPWLFGYLEKRIDKKAMVNFKIYDATDWTTNN